jgi:ABC-type phosphate transport system substrate-binding protein
MIVILFICSPALAAAGGDEYCIITNIDNTSVSISRDNLRRAFSGLLPRLGGETTVPINLPLDSAIAVRFLEDVVGKSTTSYTQYWVTKQMKGEGTAPMIQKTVAAVKKVVAQIPGAIAYIPVAEADSTVKKLKIE